MAARSLIKQLASKSYVLADQDVVNGYFLATNPTPGTGVGFGINATYDVTKNLFVFKNPNPASSGVRAYIDYFKVIPTVAPASGTAMHLAVAIDNVNRYTSGGTLVGPGGSDTPSNMNGDSNVGATCGLYYATTTVITSPAAGTSVRKAGRSCLRAVIPAVNDTIVASFGSGAPDAGASSATAAGRATDNLPPLIIGPGEWGVFTVWFPSNAATGLSYEFEFAWAEVAAGY